MDEIVTCRTCDKGIYLADAIEKEVYLGFESWEMEEEETRVETFYFCSEICKRVDDIREHLFWFDNDKEGAIEHLINQHGESRKALDLAMRKLKKENLLSFSRHY